MVYCIQNRFGNHKNLREFLALNSREGVGKTGFMGQGTLMLDHEKTIFRDMIRHNIDRHISINQVYTIKKDFQNGKKLQN